MVTKVARAYGYLGEDVLGQIGAINADLRRIVEEVLLQGALMRGSSALT